MSEKILIVDDEPNILQSIQRQLRKRFIIKTANSGAEALEMMRNEGPFAVIVSDMRMPNMTGIELLTKTKDMFPDTVRLMLTGNADQNTAMEAVNSGQIFRFLTKPCPPALFIPSLALALRQHRLIRAEKDLLQETLKGAVTVMSELLGITNPLAFSSAPRLQTIVTSIVESMNLPRAWEYEVAALLSQIGCITLPGEVLAKVFSSQELTPEEEEMFSHHPAAAAAFLEKIPRLENVTRMVSLQQMRFDEYTEEIRDNNYEEVLLGGQILKIAIDFDRKLVRGDRKDSAIQWMKKQYGAYNPKLLQMLPQVECYEEKQRLSLNVNQVSIGMIALEDIIAKNGVLIIPKGQIITKPLKDGLMNFRQQVGIVEPIVVQLPDNSAEEETDEVK